MKNLSERIVEILKQSKRISEEDIQKALVEYAKSVVNYSAVQQSPLF